MLRSTPKACGKTAARNKSSNICPGSKSALGCQKGLAGRIGQKNGAAEPE
jgi:hypothetical protein